MAEKQKPFRVVCISADQPRPHFEYFSAKEEAERWAHSAIRAGMFGQVSVEEMYEGGDWKLVAAHTATR